MARELTRRSLPSGRIARVVMSEAADGDIAVGSPEHSVPCDRLIGEAPRPWTFLEQVHGAAVAEVDRPGAATGTRADAAVTEVVGATLSLRVADCVPVALIGKQRIAVAHAGWRGLASGVLDAAVDAVRLSDGDSSGSLVAVVGPHIGSCCYEFGLNDLTGIVDLFGPAVLAETRKGRPALDLAAGVGVAMDRRGVAVIADGTCTCCDNRYWSFRATGTTSRQAMLAWIEHGSEVV